MTSGSGLWTFVKTDSRLGSWSPLGRDYTVTKVGAWVPTADVEWLLELKKHCPCAPGKGPIQIVSLARPTTEQMKQMPTGAPVLDQSKFGLRYIGG